MIGDENFAKAFGIDNRETKALEAISDRNNEMLTQALTDMAKVTMTNIAVEHKPLTIEELQKTMATIQREDHFLFIECDHIPDNAKGIFLLRKEDLKKMFPHKYKDDKNGKD